ncbi:peptidylprolyl isomerase [Candidatus Pelagibacter sp. Uisw_136]|uniref:peptidylprolyl isomerase n=1 Tax=Candidatus Pelagibacter sp. Uisw_136 TaxID=3230991 RepID=UPI0039E99FFA
MKNYLLIFFLFFIFNKAHSIETKIIHNIQNEIITNIDIKNEFKYLVSLNSNLKKLNKEKILSISNESVIRERIKKIEILKNYKEIKITEEYSLKLINNIFSRLNLKSISEFKIYLKDYDLTLEDVKRRITIDALWNELIFKKYSPKVIINEAKIREKINKNKNINSKEYMLSEIIFEIGNKEQLKKKYNEIVQSITQIGFENTASIYSFSKTAKTGGDIGWISENSINNKIKKNINNLKIGELSKPIILSNGVLLLKVTDIKISKVSINVEAEVKRAINYERDRQLNQYSKIYYNKIKKNLELNE